MSVFDQPAMGQKHSEGQHNEDERDDESQGHDEWVKFWRKHRVIKKINHCKTLKAN